MRVVVDDFEILELILKDGGWLALDDQLGQGARLPWKLLSDALQVVEVDVRVPAGPDEVARFQFALLRDHMSQQAIACTIEGQAEHCIAAALVQLAGEPLVGYVELEKSVAGGQGRLAMLYVLLRRDALVRQHGWVPCADDVAPGIRLGLDLVDKLRYLVDRLAVRPFPTAPLRSVDGPKVSVLIGPLVPNMHVPLRQVADVGAPGYQPQKLMDDALDEHFLRGDQGKPLREIKPHLRAKEALGSRPGPVFADGSVLHDVSQKIKILLHAIFVRRRSLLSHYRASGLRCSPSAPAPARQGKE